MTSGLNVLLPEVEWDGARLKSLHIHQSLEKHVANRLRPQAINVGLFDAQMKPTLIENVHISGTEQVTEVQIPAELKEHEFVALLLNVGDHGYAKIVLDERSVQAFSEGLNKVEDQLTRHILWQYLWHMVLDQRLASKTFVEVVLRHTGTERVEILIRNAWGFVGALVNNYLPAETVMSTNARVFDAVYTLLQQEGLDRNLVQMYLEYLSPFAEREE